MSNQSGRDIETERSKLEQDHSGSANHELQARVNELRHAGNELQPANQSVSKYLPNVDFSEISDKFTAPLTKGETPATALQQEHPEWKPAKIKSVEEALSKNAGRSDFKEGEQFRFNDDTSVSIRKAVDSNGSFVEETRDKGIKITSVQHRQKADGSFVETTENQRNHSSKVKTQDASGNYVINSFDGNKRLTGKEVHSIHANGIITDSTVNARGQTTKNRETKPDKSFTEKTFNSGGGFTLTNQDKDGNSSRETFDTGAHLVEKKIHHLNADGSTTDTKFDGKMNAVFNRESRADGSFSKQYFNSQGNLSLLNQDKDGNFDRTEYDKNGNKLSEIKHSRNADGSSTETETDGSGKVLYTSDNPGHEPFANDAREGEIRPQRILNAKEFLKELSESASEVEAAAFRARGQCALGARSAFDNLPGKEWNIEGGLLDVSNNVDPYGWRSGLKLALDLAQTGAYDKVPLKDLGMQNLKEGYILGRFHKPEYVKQHDDWNGEDMGDIDIVTHDHQPPPDGGIYHDSFVLIPKGIVH